MSFITERGATGALSLQAGGSFQSSTDANLASLVGTRYDLSDGREVILVGTSSATTVAAGTLYQDAAIVANHQNLGITAATAYSANGNVPASVTVTLGATTATVNQYQGGFLIVNAGTGIGQTLRIASHPAANASATCVVTLEDAPNTALSVSTSKVCLLPPHGANIIINPVTATGAVTGVGLYPIAVSSYGFLASKGIVSAISDVAVASVGNNITPSTVTAGTVSLLGSTTGVATIGYANQTAVSAEARSVFIEV